MHLALETQNHRGGEEHCCSQTTRALRKGMNSIDFRFVQPSEHCGGNTHETSPQFLGSHLKQPKLQQQPPHKPTTSIRIILSKKKQKEKSAQVSGKENIGLVPPALTHFFHPCQKGMGEDTSSPDPNPPILVSCSLQSKSWFCPKYSRRGSIFLYRSWKFSLGIRWWRKQNIYFGSHLPPPTPLLGSKIAVLCINPMAGEDKASAELAFILVLQSSQPA